MKLGGTAPAQQDVKDPEDHHSPPKKISGTERTTKLQVQKGKLPGLPIAKASSGTSLQGNSDASSCVRNAIAISAPGHEPFGNIFLSPAPLKGLRTAQCRLFREL